jgi:F420-dependent oxidoreductase-like protein
MLSAVADHVCAIHVPITTVPQTVALASRAEELGVRALWLTSGGFGPESLTTLAVIAARTSRILLGTSVVVSYSRHPLIMAQQSLAVSDVAAGRFRLGIGTGHPQTIEGAYGLKFARPLEHLREYVETLRQAFTGEVAHVGSEFRVHARMARRHSVPIYLSALRGASYRLAGRIADGAISWVTPPAYLNEVARPALRAAASASGRRRPRLVGHVMGLVTDDPERAVNGARQRLAANIQQPFYQQMFAQAGYPEALAGALPEPLLREITVVGSADHVGRGVGRYFAAGCDEVIVSLLPGSDDEVERTFRLLGELGG